MYYGSGVAIKQAIKKHGKNSFTKEVLLETDIKETALALEKDLVDYIDQQSYNMMPGGGLPPSKDGFTHTEETKRKIQEASVARSESLSRRAKQTMAERGGWTQDEIDRRVKIRKQKNNYSTDMSACHTAEAIARRTETRKKRNGYQNPTHLKDPDTVFKRTRNRIKSQMENGKKFSSATLQKYGLLG